VVPDLGLKSCLKIKKEFILAFTRINERVIISKIPVQKIFRGKMKILVTGSHGNIGRHLVRTLLEAGHTLRTLDQTAQARGETWEHLPGDVCDLSLVRQAVNGMDAVIHAAAILVDSKGNEERCLSVNILGTSNVLLACVEAGVTRVINFSSLQALGHSSPVHTALSFPLNDRIPRQPATPYQISKHVGEEMCQAYASYHGMVIISLRPTFVYQPGDYDRSWWLRQPDEDRAQICTKDYWSFVDVRDVCQACRLSLTAPLTGHQAFLLTSDYTHARTPSQELVRKYYPHFTWPNIPPEIYFKDNPYRSLVDCSSAKEVLGWQPEYDLREELGIPGRLE
jgi:UDP-glucose 4-epimerase